MEEDTEHTTQCLMKHYNFKSEMKKFTVMIEEAIGKEL